MTGSSVRSDVRPAVTPQPVKIVNWPLRDDGFWAWATAALCIAAAAWAGQASGSPLLGCAGLAALFCVTWRLWFPIQYVFHSRGIVQTVFGRSRRIPWNQIAGYRVYPNGVLLLSHAAVTPFAPIKGQFIRWNNQRQELIQSMDFFLAMRADNPQDSELRSTARHP